MRTGVFAVGGLDVRTERFLAGGGGGGRGRDSEDPGCEREAIGEMTELAVLKRDSLLGSGLSRDGAAEAGERAIGGRRAGEEHSTSDGAMDGTGDWFGCKVVSEA